MTTTDTTGTRPRIDRQVGVFFTLTFALSWLAWGPLVLLHVSGPIRVVVLVAGSFGPTAAALILSMKRSGWVGTRNDIATRARWRLPWRMWIVAVGGPAAIIVLAIALSTLAGRPVVEWQDPNRLYLIVPVFAYVTVFGGPLGEEAGWRGYALPRLQHAHHPTTAALVVGLAWGLWHAPLFAIDGTVQRSVPAAAFGIQIVTTSVVYTWLWNRTESLPLVIAFHAAFNTSVGLLPILPDTAGSPTPLWIALVLAVGIAATLIGLTGGRLGMPASPPNAPRFAGPAAGDRRTSVRGLPRSRYGGRLR